MLGARARAHFNAWTSGYTYTICAWSGAHLVGKCSSQQLLQRQILKHVLVDHASTRRPLGYNTVHIYAPAFTPTATWLSQIQRGIPRTIYVNDSSQERDSHGHPLSFYITLSAFAILFSLVLLLALSLSRSLPGFVHIPLHASPDLFAIVSVSG